MKRWQRHFNSIVPRRHSKFLHEYYYFLMYFIFFRFPGFWLALRSPSWATPSFASALFFEAEFSISEMNLSAEVAKESFSINLGRFDQYLIDFGPFDQSEILKGHVRRWIGAKFSEGSLLVRLWVLWDCEGKTQVHAALGNSWRPNWPEARDDKSNT